MLNIFNTQNLGLLIVGAVVASTCILGFFIYFNDRKNITHKTFLWFSLVTAGWGIVNYFSYKFTSTSVLIVLYRLIMFFAVLQAFFLYRLFTVFPKKDFTFSKLHKFLLLPIVLITALATLTKFVFDNIPVAPTLGEVANPVKGPGIYLFGIVAVGLVIKSIYILVYKINNSQDQNEKKAMKLLLIGISIMFTLIILFSFILSVVFENPKFVPFGGVFSFPFILFTSYAIYKHKLFNIKVASVGFIAFILTIFSFFNIIYAQSASQIVLNATFFIIILLGSITLIQTILREVEQKEHLQELNAELQSLINQRESLVHLITHKVKGSFTRSKFLFSEMLEGSFGPLSPMLESMVKRGFESDIEGINTVDLVLNSANLQNGTVKYDMKPVDFKDIVNKLFLDKKSVAESRGLKMDFVASEGDFTVLGDVFWLKEVAVNLIENSIRYTKVGEIHINLNKTGKKILLSVKDTGIGITEEDKKNLFKEGGRGKDSVKVNVDSTGYGLFSVKLIVDAHKGRVWAESEGEGKGSAFFVELDAVN